MLFYLFLFSISCLLLFQGQKSSAKWNIWTILGLFLPTFFSAIRGENVGTDTPTYLFLYEASNVLTFEEFLTSNRISVEPFYYFASKIGSYLTGFSTVMFIYQGLTVFFLYLTAYKFRTHLKIALVFFLYFTFIYPYSLNITRQVLVMMYLIWLGTFLIKGHPWIFIIGCVGGIFIHSSIAVGAIIIYWVVLIYKSNSRKHRILMWISAIGIAGMIILIRKLTPLLELLDIGEMARYGNYVAKAHSYIGKTDLVIRLLIFAILVWSYRKKIIDKKFYNAAIVLVAIEVMLIISGEVTIVIFRLALYCTCIDLMIIPYILQSNRFSRPSRLLAQWLTIGIALGYWWYTMVLRGTNETIPYYIM